MNCEHIKPLLSEFADERLEAATAWQVQTHLAECAACRHVSRNLTQITGLLRAMPTQQPSAQFDAKLAQRLAMTRRPQKQTAKLSLWQNTLTGLFARPRLRPALAVGLALTAGAAVALFPLHTTPPTTTQANFHSTDPAFVADCVAQRRRDAAGEPLADLAAQNLAGHLDSSTADNTAEASGMADVSNTADASIF